MNPRNAKTAVIAAASRPKRPHAPHEVRRALLDALGGSHVLIRRTRTRWALVDTTAEDIVASALPIPHTLAQALLRDGVITQALRHPRTYILACKETRHGETS